MGREEDTFAGMVVTPSTASTITNGNLSLTKTGDFVSGSSTSSSSTIVSGGSSFPLFQRKDAIVIRMFHADDASDAQAVSARAVLGPTWAQKLDGGMPTICTS